MDGFDWSKIKPGNASENLDFGNAEAVPAEVLGRYNGTKGLGRTVKRETKGRFVVRTANKSHAETQGLIEGTVYLIPVLKK